MISFLNRKLRTFLFLILVLVAAAFIFIDVPTSGLTGNRHLGEIRGEKVSRTDFQKYYRETELSFTLTTGQLISQFPGMQDMLLRETWNRLITLKAAEEAGITVSPDEVREYVTLHPIFQQEEKFSPERFQQFASTFFDPPGVNLAEGMNLERFESAVRHQLMIEKFNRLIQVSAIATEKEVTSLIERLHGTCTIKVAQITRQDVAKNITLDEQEVQAYYQQNLASYMTEEKRKVDYVLFELPGGIAEESDERNQALRALGEKAFRFSDPFYQAIQDQSELPDFRAAAEKAGLSIRTTDFFSAADAPKGIPGAQKIAQAAFSLTPQASVSDAIQIPNGFVVIRLAEVQQSTPQPFEAVAARVREDYRQREIERRLSIDGRQMALKVRDLMMDERKSWEAATQEAGLKSAATLTLVPSSAMRNSELPELNRLAARSASALEVNQTSPFELVGDTGYVFYIAERIAPSPEIFETLRDSTREQISAQEGAMLVREWVKSQYTAPGTNLPMLNAGNL